VLAEARALADVQKRMATIGHSGSATVTTAGLGRAGLERAALERPLRVDWSEAEIGVER
jgi:hypothetical protein